MKDQETKYLASVDKAITVLAAEMGVEPSHVTGEQIQSFIQERTYDGLGPGQGFAWIGPLIGSLAGAAVGITSAVLVENRSAATYQRELADRQLARDRAALQADVQMAQNQLYADELKKKRNPNQVMRDLELGSKEVDDIIKSYGLDSHMSNDVTSRQLAAGGAALGVQSDDDSFADLVL